MLVSVDYTNNIYQILDTDDGVIESVTKLQLLILPRRFRIFGIGVTQYNYKYQEYIGVSVSRDAYIQNYLDTNPEKIVNNFCKLYKTYGVGTHKLDEDFYYICTDKRIILCNGFKRSYAFVELELIYQVTSPQRTRKRMLIGEAYNILTDKIAIISDDTLTLNPKYSYYLDYTCKPAHIDTLIVNDNDIKLDLTAVDMLSVNHLVLNCTNNNIISCILTSLKLGNLDTVDCHKQFIKYFSPYADITGVSDSDLVHLVILKL